MPCFLFSWPSSTLKTKPSQSASGDKRLTQLSHSHLPDVAGQLLVPLVSLLWLSSTFQKALPMTSFALKTFSGRASCLKELQLKYLPKKRFSLSSSVFHRFWLQNSWNKVMPAGSIIPSTDKIILSRFS